MPFTRLAVALWSWMEARVSTRWREEEGMTATEVAVITFFLVGAAIVVMGVIYQAAVDNANNIPVPAAPGT